MIINKSYENVYYLVHDAVCLSFTRYEVSEEISLGTVVYLYNSNDLHSAALYFERAKEFLDLVEDIIK